MIKPHKYLDVKYSLVNIGAILLEALMNEDMLRISDLENILKQEIDDKAANYLLPALSLLYGLNKIEYHKELDSIEYLR